MPTTRYLPGLPFYLSCSYGDLMGQSSSIALSLSMSITNTVTTPEIAFTGDTMSDFIIDESNIDVLRAKVLVIESTFVDDTVTVEHARDYGHTHLFEIVNYADKFFEQSNPSNSFFNSSHSEGNLRSCICTYRRFLMRLLRSEVEKLCNLYSACLAKS